METYWISPPVSLCFGIHAIDERIDISVSCAWRYVPEKIDTCCGLAFIAVGSVYHCHLLLLLLLRGTSMHVGAEKMLR
jgi:hypothetical protein